MATTLSTLYPPLIETFMPAFPYNGPAIVTFSISSYNEIDSFNKIHITLSKQKTNNSVLQNMHTNKFIVLNDVWILDVKNNSYVSTKDGINYTVKIPADILKTDTGKFVIDDYYKVQIRLDSCSDSVENVRYLSSKRAFFSEWSSVCLIKAIPKISLEMSDFKTVNMLDDETISEQIVRVVQKGIVPIIGRLTYETSETDFNTSNEQATTVYDETLQKYRITITSKRTDEIIDKTDWVLTAGNQNPNQIYWLADLTNADAEETYLIKVEYYTKNQYYDSQTYMLQIASYDAAFFNPVFTFEHVTLDDNSSTTGVKKKLTTEEDGFVTLTITSDGMAPGYVYIKRATSLDNFKKWELLSCTENTGRIERTIVDKTVGSLVRYRYSVQYFFKKTGQWTETKFSKVYNLNSNFYDVYPDFHDILLLRGDKQLAIRYNTQVTSYSTVINRQVINTLGSKYPKFSENAQMNYKKVNISGLLTAESDFNRTFLNDRDYAYDMDAYDKEMGGKYAVRNDTLADKVQTYKRISSETSPNTYTLVHNLAGTTDHDLYPQDNWWWERKFRDVALEWLNDGEPKLFRSMTEGNMAVIISDISLSPNADLGRRIYNISMTAYEIGDGYSLDTLSSLGIIEVPNEYEDSLTAKGMEINSSDTDDSSEDESIVLSTIGQLYKRSAKSLSNQEELPSVLDDQQMLIVTNNNVEVFTINDFYKYVMYQGGLKVYLPQEDSYVLTDVKIQFSSKPLWFNLNSNTNNNDKITLVDLNSFSVSDLNFNSKTSVNKRDEYDTIIGGYNTATNIKKLETINNNGNAITEVTHNNYGLGYKLGITFEDPSSDNNFIKTTIFVGEKGYYQIPSNIKVKEIVLYAGAEATIDYKLSYKVKYDESSIAKEASVSKPLVGQISGRWDAGTSILPLITKKYEYQKLALDSNGVPSTNGYNGILEAHSLEDNLSAFGFDGTTYTVLRIRFKGQETFNLYTVGRTGVYNLMPDYPISELEILGRRLFRKENPVYYHSRYDTIYTMDFSTYMYQRTTADILGWQNLSEGVSEAPVLVIYNDALDENSSSGLIENNIRQLNNSQTGIDLIIGDLGPEFTGNPYDSIGAIDNPQVNTIYGFYNEDNEIILKLYDDQYMWRDIEVGWSANDNIYILNIKGSKDPIKTKMKKFGLYDWEYDLDPSADPDYIEEMLTWRNVLLGNTSIPVVVGVTNGNISFSNHIFKVGEEENIPALDGYNSIKDIKNPQYNIVYGIKTNYGKVNKIYYIDGHWYDIDQYSSDDNLTILAKVPIDGMLNYRGRIITLIYDNSIAVSS